MAYTKISNSINCYPSDSLIRIPTETAWSKLPPIADEQYQCACFNILQKAYSPRKNQFKSKTVNAYMENNTTEWSVQTLKYTQVSEYIFFIGPRKRQLKNFHLIIQQMFTKYLAMCQVP